MLPAEQMHALSIVTIVVTMWLKGCLQVYPKLFPICQNVVFKFSRGFSKIVPKLFQCCLKVVNVVSRAVLKLLSQRGMWSEGRGV